MIKENQGELHLPLESNNTNKKVKPPIGRQNPEAVDSSTSNTTEHSEQALGDQLRLLARVIAQKFLEDFRVPTESSSLQSIPSGSRSLMPAAEAAGPLSRVGGRDLWD